MKKIVLIYIVIGLFLFGQISGIAFNQENEENEITDIIDYHFSEPSLVEKNDYTSISIQGITQFTRGDALPMLPVKTIQKDFPYGTKIVDIQFIPSESTIRTINQPVCPTAQLIHPEIDENEDENINSIYSTNQYYPTDIFEYSLKVGRNDQHEKTLMLIASVYPVQYHPINNEISYITEGKLLITYQSPKQTISSLASSDLLIITASAYKDEFEVLKTHKESLGISTKLVSIDEINTHGRDLAEKIKKYIYQEDIPYVLLVGGYRSFLGFDVPELQLPLRWIWTEQSEPGYVSDLYFADTTYYDETTGTYQFDDWDSNGNGIYGEDSWTGWDDMDMMPDVILGRLACRNEKEAQTVVDKIIHYEQTDHTNEDWFNRVISFTGDDFQDVTDWNIYWDTSSLSSGTYVINAQTTNCDGMTGNVHSVTVTVNKNGLSTVSFSEKDHEITDREYPYQDPIAYITVPSDGDILGSTDVLVESPPGAYEGSDWTSIDYEDGIIGIKGKAYDPRTQGGEDPDRPDVTVHVWVTYGGTQIQEWSVDCSCWFEGEFQAQLALDYFPESYEKQKIWTSNGGLHGTEPSGLEPQESPKVDGTESARMALEDGCGFLYLCGHASPIGWGNHYPGIPGGRALSDVSGFKVVRIPKSVSDILDLFPLNDLNNGDHLPITVISGCHPLALDCSLTKAFFDFHQVFYEDFGKFGPECLGWWLTKMEQGGSIATFGPAGLGTGTRGSVWEQGAGTQFWSEGFFRILNENNHEYLGDVYKETQEFYLTKFSPLDLNDKKTLTEMLFLGDPTLKIGGYSTQQLTQNQNQMTTDAITSDEYSNTCPDTHEFYTSYPFIENNNEETMALSQSEYQVTFNPLEDTKPEAFITNGNGDFLVGYAREVQSHHGIVLQDGFSISKGGVIWKELLKANGDDTIVHQGLGYTGFENKAVGTRYNGQESNFDIILMDDMTDESTWEVRTYYSTGGDIFDRGKNACDIAGDYEDDEFFWISGATISTIEWNNGMDQVAMFSTSTSSYSQIFIIGGNYIAEQVTALDVEVNRATQQGFFAVENPDGLFIGHIDTTGAHGINTVVDLPFIDGENPDVAIANGNILVVYEQDGGIEYLFSSNAGIQWVQATVTSTGNKPEVVSNNDGSFDCYFEKNGNIYTLHGEEDGTLNIVTWNAETIVDGIINYNAADIFAATNGGIVYPRNNGDLYAHIMEETSGISITDLEVFNGNQIKASIQNGGTLPLDETWSIEVIGTNPYQVFNGIIFSGKETTGPLHLQSGEKTTIESQPIRGIGFCDVVVKVGDTSKTEDGIIVFKTLRISHGVE